MVDGKPVEGTFRAHQVPVEEFATKPENLKILETWMRSYKPEELLRRAGSFRNLLSWPQGRTANGSESTCQWSLLLKELEIPDFHDHAVKVSQPGVMNAEATASKANIRGVFALNADTRNFRGFSPDETLSNRWSAVFEETDRCSTAEGRSTDDYVGPDGRAMEMLSETQCEGWLKGTY